MIISSGRFAILAVAFLRCKANVGFQGCRHAAQVGTDRQLWAGGDKSSRPVQISTASAIARAFSSELDALRFLHGKFRSGSRDL